LAVAFAEMIAIDSGEPVTIPIRVRRLRFFWTQIWGKTCVPNWSS
jgi:hypothetical protein